MCLIIDNRYHKGKEKKFKICKPNEIVCSKIVYYSDETKKFITPFTLTKISYKDLYIKAESFQEKPISTVYRYWNIEKQKPEAKKVYIIQYGIHAYTNLNYATGELLKFGSTRCGNEIIRPCLIRCYIEKGVKFWMGENHQICAEKLRLDDEFKYYENPKPTFKQIIRD